MGVGDWLKQCFNRGAGCADLCGRCSSVLAPVVGSHTGSRAGAAGGAIAAHGRLRRRAWRSAYVQEGGEDLYQCQDCGSWWGLVFWACVPEEALVRHQVRSVEAWVKEWPKGEVVQ